MHRALNISYLFQSAGTLISDNKALQVHIYNLVKGLQNAGHHVTITMNVPGRKVLCTEDIHSAREGILHEDDFADNGWVGSKTFLLIESAIRRLQAILHLPYLALFDSLRIYSVCTRNLEKTDLFHERYNVCSIGGALASRRLGIPMVLEVNADMLEEYEYIGLQYKNLRKAYAVWATRFCFHTADRIVSVSSDLKEHLVGKWHLPPEKILVLPNAADVDLFGQEIDQDHAREKLSLGKGPLVVFVGGFYRWHALELLVKSFHLVLDDCPTAQLLLIGDGYSKLAIEQKVAALNMAPAVRFLGGINHEFIPQYLAAADVAVAPFEAFFPWKGGSALKVFEYMAAGKAIVATRTGQVAEVLKSGHNGILVFPGDVNGFARSILSLLNDPAERARLGQNARQDAITQHSWAKYIDRLTEIYMGAIQ